MGWFLSSLSGSIIFGLTFILLGNTILACTLAGILTGITVWGIAKWEDNLQPIL